MIEIDTYTQEDWKRMEKELASIGAEILPPDPLFKVTVRNVLYQGNILPKMVVPLLKDIIKFEAKEDDIYVATFYKSGTTWMQKIVYLICKNPNCKSEANEMIDYCFPYMEFRRQKFNLINNMPSPRLIKTHLPHQLLPQSVKDKKCKIIYVARNPKDVIVSSYFFVKDIKIFQFDGTLEQHAQRIMDGVSMFCPYWGHVLDFWNRKDDRNILFIKYEDMQKDLIAVVKQVAKFLNKHLNEEQIQNITKNCTFKAMSQDPTVNRMHWIKANLALENFKSMRKGKIGDWKNYFSQSLNEAIDKWTEEHSKNTDIVFDYEI